MFEGVKEIGFCSLFLKEIGFCSLFLKEKERRKIAK